MEGHTEYGKPVFDCILSIAWRADLLLTPTIKESVDSNSGESLQEGSGLIESLLKELPSGRPRLAAKMAVSKVSRLIPQAAWASAQGTRGPPSAVLSDTAKYVQCRGPLSNEECAQVCVCVYVCVCVCVCNVDI